MMDEEAKKQYAELTNRILEVGAEIKKQNRKYRIKKYLKTGFIILGIAAIAILILLLR